MAKTRPAVRPWLDPSPLEIPAPLAAEVGRGMVGRLLARRGFSDVQTARAFLDPDFYRPALAWDLPDMYRAVDRITRAIEAGELLCVWGDFDVDGQTSTALLVSTLSELGGRVIYHIPVREHESHGVTLPALEQVIQQGARLVVTCDTGITAHAAVDYARQRGVDMILTDHHELSEVLPDAQAVINPHRLADGHPLAALPGVGVAYKLAEALYERAGRPGEAEQYLDLVAMGIVADVAMQTGDVRYLLQRGLAALRLRPGPLRPGVRAMLELAEMGASERLSEETIGFLLGPRLNALGRLADANPAVELLTTRDETLARSLAGKVEELNSRRKLLTDQVFQAAQAQVENDPELLKAPALVLASPAWPAGVIGIVASRLVEQYRRPVVLLSAPAAPDGQLARGSARSIDGIHITEALRQQAGRLANFGGHAMAGGLAIAAERIPEFRRAFVQTIKAMQAGQAAQNQLVIDEALPLGDVSLELVDEVEKLAPFGPGNPAPIFAAQKLSIRASVPIGRSSDALALTVEDESARTFRVIWWGGAGRPLPEGLFDLAYGVRSSTFKGERQVQIEWVDARPHQESAVPLSTVRPVRVVDHRHVNQKAAVLRGLLLDGSPKRQVWCEADARRKLELPGGDPGDVLRTRYTLESAEELVIWTTPSGSAALRQVMERVSPSVVYLFGVNPAVEDLDGFLNLLAGAVKYCLRTSQGKTALSRLAAATAQSEGAVRLGLQWLVEGGHISLVSLEGDDVCLAEGQGGQGTSLARTAGKLAEVLAEAAAYRSYFSTAAPDFVLK